jgi:hypothetical protein
MRANAGMANRQGDVNTLAWLGLKSTQDSQFIAEAELQIMTMEVTFSSKQFCMDRDNTNGR